MATRAVIPDARAVYVFGSYSRGEARPESDIDLAVLPARPLSPVERFDKAQALAARLMRDVDLVDLSRAPVALVAQVLAEGEQLMCSDELQVGLFETHAMTEYAHLNERRRGLIEDVLERGSIHGR
ncbi:MAG: nucleotidyltransferase domain-containing protein [Myxococcaceae bacterium]|nr:nucleotidyltransferase domain-containing protein [Myxococcaceae bacterium]MCI0672374.1 nucleotidyltransferase domain-containing protein [Myxococcaceae bacterium]